MKAGFDYAPVRGKGSHQAFVKKDEDGQTFLVIVPKRNPMPRGTLLSIIKQSGLSRGEFIKLLGK
jgi:predicted RNA binding protein YcfA (HicA-like mRNA interferase family)